MPQSVFSAQPGGGTISLRKLYVLYVAQAGRDRLALWKRLSSESTDIRYCIYGFILVYFVYWQILKVHNGPAC